MTIVVNGERHEIPEGLTVAALLDHLGMTTDRVAIERNLDILPRARWGETKIQPNDSFEIVHFVGGGSFEPALLRTNRIPAATSAGRA
ncbi:MAG: sulfur carrier protein ThiS [Candidatus Acidiferrales bacterium]